MRLFLMLGVCLLTACPVIAEERIHLTLYVPTPSLRFGHGLPAILEINNHTDHVVRFSDLPIYGRKIMNDPRPPQTAATRPEVSPIDQRIDPTVMRSVRELKDVVGIRVTVSAEYHKGMSYPGWIANGPIHMLQVQPGESYLLKITVPASKFTDGRNTLRANIMSGNEIVAESQSVEISVDTNDRPTTRPLEKDRKDTKR